MAYNLLGQQGTKGNRNPDPNLSPEVATYIYDTPPGEGENKGVKDDLTPVNQTQAKRKLEELPEETPVAFTGTSVIETEKGIQGVVGEPFKTTTKVFDSGISQWWQFLGYDSLDEANKSIAMGELSMAAVNRAKEEVKPEPADAIPPEEKEIPEYPKTLFNDKGQVSTVNNETEEYFAKRMGYISEPKNLSLSAGINLLRDYEEKKDFTVTDKEKIEIETNQTKANLDNLLNTGEISQGEFNAFSKALNNLNNNAGTELKTGSGIKNENKNDIQKKGQEEEKKNPGEDKTIVPPPVSQPPAGGIVEAELNNVPKGSYVWEVSGQLYLAYEVPGAGDIYEGAPIFMAYKVAGNDLVSAGLITEGGPLPEITPLNEELFNATTIVFGGDTQQLTALIDNPFVGFVESVSDQLVVAPWMGDQEMVGLVAEAALEGRTVTDAELKGTNWWRTHNEAEREYLETYYGDPATSAQQRTDAEISVANTLQAQGVSNAPEALVNWIAGQFVTGKWSQAYTSEQIALFADPYATGKRDESLENYLSSTALTGLDRTTEREREVRELYNKWLGPSLGKLTDTEVAEIAGKLRDDPDYEDALIGSLKQSRLAAFSNYTNPELTYEDIARPWRNLTTSVWGQTADETQGWWQEMVKSNDFATAQTTLREKGLEQDVTQVTQDATKALQQALGQGQVSQSGVNV